MQLKTNQLLLFFILSCVCCSDGLARDSEVSVLLSIKAGLVDKSNVLGDWVLPERDFVSGGHCNWSCVSCNGDGLVDKLDLSHKNLSGKVVQDIQGLRALTSLNLCCNALASDLPTSLANLTALRSLDVSQNFFAGSFPSGLGRASELSYLNASGNDFVGPLPEDLGNATSLESLDFRGSFFHGTIPRSFKNLRKLRFLGLSGNNLTGAIPPELGELSSLETVIIGYNEFEGGIPAEFGNLTALKYLDLSVGNLGSRIPGDLGRLKNLETMYLFRNNFGGEIPPEIGSIASLKVLDLSDNVLSGQIPGEISNLENLQLLNLMCNRLSGSVPSSLGKLPSLEVLALWNNSLSGQLPSDLGKNSPLQWLDVSSNSLSGPIPETLCDRGNLTKLILFNNAFSGPIPAGLSSCSSLVRVRIHNNHISGSVPIGFGKLGNLQRLELSNNSLTGQIPDDLSSSLSLAYIDLASNRLSSLLPSTILSIPSLQNFILSNNNLEGTIPGQFQDCPSLSVLDLSSNRFSGEIPASIASCERLVTLNLRDNRLTGEIPKQIATMPLLSVLDLSDNSLSGGIPQNLGLSPALETLNVSHNRLEGPVPENGVLRTINPSDLVGNPGLCGSVLIPCSRSLERFASGGKSVHAKHVIASFVIGISSVLALGITVFGVRSLYKRWYSNGVCFGDRFRMSNGGDWPWRLMAFQRLGFSSSDILACVKESNVIGVGATGTVYKAEIPRSSNVVAVKKLWRSGVDIEAGNSNDLVGEVNLLGRLRHRNIVRLLGFLHNDSDIMILYEFMPNGNLGDALHGKLRSQRLLVDWVSRYNIAVGVAQGLAYLHHDCHPPVIHRDVKSNNILLDANLDARIADFGLARMMVRKNETVSMVAGSYGYMAPELGYTLKIDEKVDIYSYGVVLLELVTGKRPLESEFGESVDIVEWIRRKIRDSQSLEEALDSNVGNCKHVQEEMLLVLRIALVCTARLPKDRPSMRDVMTMLGEAKPRRKSSSINIDGNKDSPIFTTSSPVNGLL